MRPGRSQTDTNFEICQNEIIPGRFRSGHNSFYNRYSHVTGTKIAQTGLKSSRLLTEPFMFRPGWNLFEFTFIPLWFHLGLNIVGSV